MALGSAIKSRERVAYLKVYYAHRDLQKLNERAVMVERLEAGLKSKSKEKGRPEVLA